jgi:TolB-like protein
MNRTIFAFAAALAVPATLSAQQADTRTTLAVLPFANSAVQPELAPLSKGFQALLLNDLATNTRIRVIERDEIQRILDEQKLSTTGQVDQSTAVRMGKLLGAKFMITGTYITTPDKNLTITVRAFDTETGEVVYTDKTAETKVDNMMTAIATAARNANAKLNLPQLAPGSPGARDAAAQTEQAKKMPLATAMLYARALEAEDSGKPAEAVTLYKQVLDKFPYPPAQQALAKLSAK